MEVCFCAVKSRAVSNRNCVAARRGGEQRNENDQSVTQTARMGRRSELDSVGVDGRAFERMAKPVGAGANPLAAGRSPVVAPMVGDGMAGSHIEIIRETRWGQTVFMAGKPEEPPGGSQSVRSSGEAGNDRGAKGRRKVEVRRTERRRRKPTRVSARTNRWRNQPSAIGLGDTERLTDALGDRRRAAPSWKPLTGKPDAGDPPVRFGGRGGAKASSLPLSNFCRS